MCTDCSCHNNQARLHELQRIKQQLFDLSLYVQQLIEKEQASLYSNQKQNALEAK